MFLKHDDKCQLCRLKSSFLKGRCYTLGTFFFSPGQAESEFGRITFGGISNYGVLPQPVPSDKKCYSSDHVEEGGLLPYGPEAEVSSCGFSDISYSNGLCAPSKIQRQYFTPHFTSPCTDDSQNSPSTYPEIGNNNKKGQVAFHDAAHPERIIHY